jgi:hypothetical protein
MRTKLFFPLALALAASVAIGSCRKSDRDEDKETQSSSDNAIAESAFNDIFKQLDDAASATPDVNRLAPGASVQAGCATVTVNPALPNTSFPKTLTVDFGSSYVLCSDGRYRKGIITATFSGKYRDSLTVITISTNNYYVDNYAVQGTKTITNKGRNSSGNIWFDINVQNAIITTPQGKTITWQSARQREWIAGEGTLANVLDDVYLITGSATGTGTTGNSFSATITQALRVEIGCKWIVSGKLTLQPENIAARYIDFGAGGCDNAATVTINGNTYNIEMN